MKQTIAFEFDPEHDIAIEDQVDLINSATRLHTALCDVWQWLRNLDKYGDEETIAIADAREKLREILEMHEVIRFI